MKKYVFAVVLFLCGLGLFFFLKTGLEKKVQAADFLPADVLFYGEQHDFTRKYKDFINSRLGKVLSSIKYQEVADELGLNVTVSTEALNRWHDVDSFLNDPGFDQILGKEFSLALFSAKSFSAANPAKALEERLLLIARPRHNAQLLQFLAPYISKDIEQSTVRYGSHAITRYQIDKKNTLSTATVKGLVLAAIDERLVRKSLDMYDDQQDSLAGNKDYQQLRKNFKDAEFFQYVSLPALMAQGRMIAGDLHAEDQRQFLALIEQWDGLGAAAYGAWTEKGLLKEKIEIFFEPEKLNSDVASLVRVKPSGNETLGMVPADTLLYYWNNNLDLSLIWKMYSDALVKQRPEVLELLQQELQDSVGMGLEDILAMIDSKCGIIIKDIDVNGIPIPKAMLMMQLKDPEKFIKVLNELLLVAEIPMNKRKYKGYDISYWGIAPQDGLQPAFALFGQYLLLSNSRDLIKQVVALKENPEEILLKNPELQELREELTQKNNSATYIHIALMADSLKNLATWAGGMAVLQGPETAQKANMAVKELILPLLDGIAMYSQFASRSEVKEKSMVVESTILIVE